MKGVNWMTERLYGDFGHVCVKRSDGLRKEAPTESLRFIHQTPKRLNRQLPGWVVSLKIEFWFS